MSLNVTTDRESLLAPGIAVTDFVLAFSVKLSPFAAIATVNPFLCLAKSA